MAKKTLPLLRLRGYWCETSALPVYSRYVAPGTLIHIYFPSDSVYSAYCNQTVHIEKGVRCPMTSEMTNQIWELGKTRPKTKTQSPVWISWPQSILPTPLHLPNWYAMLQKPSSIHSIFFGEKRRMTAVRCCNKWPGFHSNTQKKVLRCSCPIYCSKSHLGGSSHTVPVSSVVVRVFPLSTPFRVPLVIHTYDDTGIHSS